VQRLLQLIDLEGYASSCDAGLIVSKSDNRFKYPIFPANPRAMLEFLLVLLARGARL
jgi:hypothetical protein